MHLVNSKNRKDTQEAKAKLMNILNELQKKYGDHPSILATLADFSGNSRERLRLWNQAYRLAINWEDKPNQQMIAHSVCGFMILEKEDALEGEKWLNILKVLSNKNDPSSWKDYLYLRRQLKQLNNKNINK